MTNGSFRGHPDHDACGTGLIVHLGQPASHEVVDRGLVALQRLAHRGGVDADGSSGDGSGLLTAIPQQFIRRCAEELGFILPQSFGMGMLFLPLDEQERAKVRKELECLAADRGLRCLGWREVPVKQSVLGSRAAETAPSIWQCFLEGAEIAKATEIDGGLDRTSNHQLEARLFLFRKRAEIELSSAVYFCSLSSRTVVYKGLLAPWQLPIFYPDLDNQDFESQFVLFHQRFSTNTQPSWPLAQPFRFLAHNGEINTIAGNRRWAHAREIAVRRETHAAGQLHGLEENVSDSASLDNALELLVQQGFSPEAGLLTLTPPAFESSSRFDPFVRGFLESSAREYEPWDGPAALVFSDGRMVGAKLDRNGLRPLRYIRTADGWLVVGSEAGIADLQDKQIIERQRLGPGEMLVADLRTGDLLRGDELLSVIAAQPQRAQFSHAAHLPLHTGTREIATPEEKRIAAALGWSQDQLRILFEPLAEGKEAIWSMGDDTPPAFMSQVGQSQLSTSPLRRSGQRRTLWDYCKQRFAQVTNPPIDPFRESHVMSLRVRMGEQFISESPVLDSQQLEFLRRHARGHQIDITFAAASGVPGALQALERIQAEAIFNHREELPLVLLSDCRVGADRAALPALLATGAVWKAMVQAGKYRTPLIVETGQALDTHHVALLLAVGASAVSPFLAMRLAEEHQPNGAANYCHAIDTGLKKVLSRMGISTIASYRNGQLFETVGLGRQLCGEFFESATHVAGIVSLQQVLQDYLHNHELAFRSDQAGLRDAGLYRYGKQGEQHETSPELLRKLHAHVKIQTPESYRDFEELGWNREPIAIRDWMELVPQEPVEISEVESESEILRRFSTQAMSLGAISPEAHRTLALAMNRLGARSNTGEGGEDPALYSREPEAANKVKQIASGRFGVTTEYLVNAQEIEIKMAQGSKPGEGGQLPANKVTPYIARLRHAVPGMSLISPPPHHDIYSIEDLAQLIHDLREVNPEARIGVKLVAGAGVGVIAAGVVKAGADVITISGHNGGTGASPLSSIKNTGLPWEFGLHDAHRTLVNSGLRQRVRLRVDGGLKFARDVVIAALLGADEFGFGTAALLAIGCVMARQCHLNTCPAGIATQDEALRTRFTGNPEMVIAYFQAMASEVRMLLATLLGARTIDEIVGGTGKLKPRYRQSGNPQSSNPQSGNPQSLHRESHPHAQDQSHDQESWDWIQALLHPMPGSGGGRVVHKKPTGLARQLAGMVRGKTSVRKAGLRITNADLSVGAHLSGEIVRQWGGVADESGPLEFEFCGVAGQSFGAFLVAGIHFRLLGEANDYAGKGLSGGSIVISAGREASRRGDVLAGNTLLYGATSGELYIAGRAGERFAVRNSGALAVVEGLGDHGCEYMTGGVVLVLGSTGMNFGSGMTGGLAYVLADHLAEDVYNRDFVRLVPCSPEEESALRQVLTKHFHLTESPRAARLLDSASSLPLVRVQPSTLPCSVDHTWATVQQRSQGPVSLETPVEVQPI